MDIWVLTRETGSYSEYSMEVLAVTDTTDRAKALAGEQVKDEHLNAIDEYERDRADWPARCAQNGFRGQWAQPFEEDHRPPTLIPLAWIPNPERAGDWHFSPHRGERWSIFRAELNEWAPDGQEWSMKYKGHQ